MAEIVLDDWYATMAARLVAKALRDGPPYTVKYGRYEIAVLDIRDDQLPGLLRYLDSNG